MRLWSIHPKYLDRLGLCGLWREALQAQSVLLKREYSECKLCEGEGRERFEDFPYNGKLCIKCKGKGKIKTGYWNHPQLERFKQLDYKSYMWAIKTYLWYIYLEAQHRSYNFDSTKIQLKTYFTNPYPDKLTVTNKQIEYEFNHLQKKLESRFPEQRDENYYITYGGTKITPHPLFEIIEGDIESWEKVNVSRTR